jgi:hypothetical protein
MKLKGDKSNEKKMVSNWNQHYCCNPSYSHFSVKCGWLSDKSRPRSIRPFPGSLVPFFFNINFFKVRETLLRKKSYSLDGGVGMSWLTEGISTGYTFFRIPIFLLLIIGVVTAYLNISFGGFSPIFWFLLALCGLFDITINLLLQIRTTLQKK